MSFCCLSVHGGSFAKPSIVEIASTILAIGSLFISARFITRMARRIDGDPLRVALLSGRDSSKALTKWSAFGRACPLPRARKNTVLSSSGRTTMPCRSGPSRTSGSRSRALQRISGLNHDFVRSSPGSPASTPTLAHSPAKCAARRSSSPNPLACSSDSKPRQPMTSQDASRNGCDGLSGSIVITLPASDAAKALSVVANNLPTRNFSHRRYPATSATNQSPWTVDSGREHSLRYPMSMSAFPILNTVLFVTACRNLSTTLRHRRFLFTDSFLLLWKWRVG